MKLKIIILITGVAGLSYINLQKNSLPDGFVYIKDVDSSIDTELRYYSKNNFIGDTIDAYNDNKLIISRPTALALKKVQDELMLKNMCLRIYDGYRPQTAVNHFMRWAKKLDDTIKKSTFYPNVKKMNLFKEGYIASKSGHSRGSTVDLTIIDASTDKPLDMGSPYDYFGIESWVDHSDLTNNQKTNRKLLQEVMIRHGFRNYPKEWWHFTLKNEPYPDTYFDFPVE